MNAAGTRPRACRRCYKRLERGDMVWWVTVPASRIGLDCKVTRLHDLVLYCDECGRLI